jgi:hypothetical protein
VEELKEKAARIAVDYLAKERLDFGDPVEILEQEVVSHELIGCRLALKVKSLKRLKAEKWIWKSEVVFVRDKGRGLIGCECQI